MQRSDFPICDKEQTEQHVIAVFKQTQTLCKTFQCFFFPSIFSCCTCMHVFLSFCCIPLPAPIWACLPWPTSFQTKPNKPHFYFTSSAFVFMLGDKQHLPWKNESSNKVSNNMAQFAAEAGLSRSQKCKINHLFSAVR